jgi:hypothetical protein
MTIPEFWRRADFLPRAGLVTAGTALLINISTYFGLAAIGWATPLYLMHLVVMALGFWLFARIVAHNYEYLRHRPLERGPVGVPWQLVMGTVVSCLYLLVLIVRSDSAHEAAFTADAELRGPAYYSSHSSLLGVFSAAWLFFALLTATSGFYINERRSPTRRAFGDGG